VADREIDAGIIEACRRGDRDAFRALYESYRDKVYSISLYFFHGNEADAADVTQEVFVKLYAGMESFRGDALFSTWLYRLVRNSCLDGSRGKAARARNLQPEARIARVSAANQEEDLMRGEAARAVQRAVSQLPPKFRLPILLRHFEELSYEEMAATLNCSMGTVASRLSRGHRMLCKLLTPGGRP
jgi:RNA polymerase sigma-70 factor (ECF subfamily)